MLGLPQEVGESELEVKIWFQGINFTEVTKSQIKRMKHKTRQKLVVAKNTKRYFFFPSSCFAVSNDGKRNLSKHGKVK